MNYRRLVILLIIYQCVLLRNVQSLEVPKHMRSGAKKLTNLCIKETGVTEDLFIEAQETGKMPNNQRLKCFIHCVLDKIGLIDADNIVHLDNLLEILPPEFVPIVEELHTTCGTQSGADGCETAFLTTECYIKTNPVILKLLFTTFSE
ncbi:general odorant-binding protein 69a precursor [Ceratitis capitata]|uniref:Odorant binding protein OBP69a n=2 Tax=Ceratitis capitata TaxID=7213 RepID=W8W3V2_CERCA|nr:general odorant-binding protein 69a precursor [Ceratitis capitata]CDJ79886.1 odorant binding protein OBP69a [Ceratitis capitata]